jgi:hypothetical protein
VAGLVSTGAEEFAAFLRAETVKPGKVVREAGIRLE